MKNKIVYTVFIIVFLLFTVIPINVKAESNGQCGDNVYWSLSDDGVLTISGTGNMYDYSAYGTSTPWYSERASISKVIMENGINNIGGGAFAQLENLTEIAIPNSITSIDEGAFVGCKSLVNITIPDSVTSLGRAALASTGISSISLSESVTEMGADIFKNCDRLTEVDLPNSITIIPQWAFSGCKSLTNIVIPDSVTCIDEYAFVSSSLTSIIIPENVNYIGCQALANTKITTIVIPNSVTQLKSQVFFCCSELKSAVIGNGVTTISYGTFQGCSNLEKISIGIGVNKINYNAFEYINNLNAVYYSGSADDWSQIDIDYYLNGNNCLLGVTKYYNCGWTNDSQLMVLDERFYHNLSYYATFCNSTQYNPELAHLMMTFANAAYTPDDVETAYSQLGLSEYDSKFYNENYADYGTEKSPFSVGYTIDDNGTMCVLITIRGSGDIRDISQGLMDWLGNASNLCLYEYNGCNVAENFYNTMNNVYNQVDSYIYDNLGKNITDLENTKFFVTGHSRGAAVANLLEIKLGSEVGNQNVYGYNFAVPNVVNTLKSKDLENGYENIFNISNIEDPVSYLPSDKITYMAAISTYGTIPEKYKSMGWRKFGVSVCFSDGNIDVMNYSDYKNINKNIDKHMGYVYLAYMRQRKAINEYAKSDGVHEYWNPYEYDGDKMYTFCCPVNVELIDENGSVIVSIIDDEVNYTGNNNGKVIAAVYDDKKVFVVPKGKNYTLRIVGYDSGTMEYYIEEFGNDESIVSAKAYEGVSIIKGKEMTSEVTSNLDAENTQLFVVNENNVKTHEILSDGSEVNPIFVNKYNVKIVVGDTFEPSAESTDNYNWYSTDESIATIENGVVTAVSSGTANIIAETVNGARAICRVTVYKNGDVNKDGRVSIRDVTTIQLSLVDIITLDDAQVKAADVNCDNEIDIDDATTIQMYLAHLIDVLPVESLVE